jgi:hypothetical protein
LDLPKKTTGLDIMDGWMDLIYDLFIDCVDKNKKTLHFPPTIEEQMLFDF